VLGALRWAQYHSLLRSSIPCFETKATAVRRKAKEESVHYIWVAIIGLIVGALAKFIMPGKDPGGIIVTMIIGIVGSFIGTVIGRALGMYNQGEAAGFIMSLLGAIILLALYRMIIGRRTRTV
jgi:uncharacterized membrane protein YeaQ/YmgE (transglycosylase-associated protein family)